MASSLRRGARDTLYHRGVRWLLLLAACGPSSRDGRDPPKVDAAPITVTHVEPHAFTDGCGWQATETLTGTIDPATCALGLSYAYAEMVVTDNGGCATPCSGTADLTFTITPILM